MAELEDGTLSFEARLELVSKDVQNVKQQLVDIAKSGANAGSVIDKSLQNAFSNLTTALGGSTGAVVEKLNELVSVSQTSATDVKTQLQSIQEQLTNSFNADVPRKHFDEIKDGAKNAGEAIETVLTPMIEKAQKAMKRMVAGFTVQQLITQIGKTRGEFQQLEVAFETMLGSEEKSAKLMNELVNTAAHTPFDLKGIADGAKQLLAYGFAAEDVNDTLVMLGNVASGLSIPLNDIVYLYGTTMTQGRLFTQDLRQFMGRGIPLAEELSKQFGVTKDKVGDLVTEGKVGFNEVAKAMKAMTSEGGQFYNLMDKQSKTINGLVSNLGDAIDTMMNDVGKKTEGIFADTLKVAINVVENYERVGKAIVELLAVLGPVKATMVVVNMLQQHHNKIMREAVALRAANTKANIQMSVSDTVAAAKADLHARAAKRLNIALTKTGLTNPYVLLAAGAAALGLAIYKAHQNQNKFNAVLADIDKAAAKNTATINVEITKLERLKGKLAGCKEGSEEYLSAKNEIIDNFAKYDETLKDEGDSYDALKVKLDALTDSIKNTLSARAAEEELATKTEELTDEYAENINKLEKKLLKKLTPEMAARAMQEISLGLANGTIEAAAKTETKGWWSGTFVELKGVSKEVADAMKEATMTGGGYISALGSKIIGLVDDCKDLNKEMTELPTLIYGKFGATLNEKKEEVITNNNGNNNNENENEDEEDAKKKAEERKKAQKKYKEEIKEAIVKGEHDIAQAQIDAMEEGAEKQDAQLRLNYNKRLNEIKRQEENYKQKNKELYGSAELTDDQKRVLQQMRDLADNELNVGFSLIKKGKDKQTEDKLKERLQMWQEYCEKQTAITEEYAEKRKKIEDDKTLTEEDRNKRNAQLDQQERNDMAILIAQMGITDQNIADELTKIIVEAYSLATDGAVEELQNQLLVVETQLQEMLKSGVNEQNEEVFRRLQTQQKALTKAIVKAKSAQTDLQNKSSKAGLTIKDKMDIATGAMSSLNGAIGEVRNAFGDLFDDVTNDALDAIQTTMESGIGVLNAIKAAGVGTATAISTAEKASVILTVISAAVQVTMALVKALSNFSASAKARKMAEGYKKAADSYRREYEKLRHEHRNSVGTQYYDEMFKDINALYKEEEKLEKAIRAKRRERNLAATDKRKEKIQQELNDLEDQRRELEEKIEDEERKFYENLLTTNATDYASTMADQLVEGWESGLRDMTSVFDDAINDMLRSVVKSQLRMKLEEIYKTAFDEMQKDFGSTSEFTQNDLDAIKDRVNAANEEAKAVADFYRQWWDALELNTGDLSASVGAIQGMTQDTAEELNGRFTALQMSGASIDLKMDSVVAGIHSLIGTNSGIADSIALAVGIANDQLNVLEDIRNHTARLASMERSLNTITNQMSTLTGQ